MSRSSSTDSTNSLKHRRHIWPWVLFGSIFVTASYIAIQAYFPLNLGSEILVAVLSGIFGTAFFFHKVHAEDARFVKDLLTDFNRRYDKLNDELILLLNMPNDKPLSPHEELVIVDYFNLCAEEWLFYQAGYIWDPVWNSWHNGMLQYAKLDCFKRIWDKEKSTNSYYGFKFPIANELH